MSTQIIKVWSLFLSTLFTILAISNYFGSGKVYAPLIAAAFIMLLAGEILVLIDSWHFDRRKLELTKQERENWMFRRQSD